MSTIWQVNLDGKITQPVVAGERVFVASVDSHTVRCLDARDGKPLWSYTVGGRVDSPPTVYRGLVLFGSADGWAYCLRYRDGELAGVSGPRRRIVAWWHSGNWSRPGQCMEAFWSKEHPSFSS